MSAPISLPLIWGKPKDIKEGVEMTKRKLTDSYVSQLLGLPVNEARGVEDLIEIKRLQVELQRAIIEKQKRDSVL